MKKTILVLWRIWFYFLCAIPVLVLFPFLAIALFFSGGYKVVYWIARNIWAPFVMLGCGFWIKRLNTIPELMKTTIIIANHASYIDILLMFRLFKKPFVFVGKKELANIPVFGYLYKRAAIMVDRSDKKSRYSVYGFANRVISKGYSICIFPERDYLDESILLNPFKRGAFKMAIEHQIPILPLVFYDCKRKFPWYTTYGYPGPLRVKALPKIAVLGKKENELSGLLSNSHQKIENALLDDEKKAALNAIDLWNKIKKAKV